MESTQEYPFFGTDGTMAGILNNMIRQIVEKSRYVLFEAFFLTLERNVAASGNQRTDRCPGAGAEGREDEEGLVRLDPKQSNVPKP